MRKLSSLFALGLISGSAVGNEIPYCEVNNFIPLEKVCSDETGICFARTNILIQGIPLAIKDPNYTGITDLNDPIPLLSATFIDNNNYYYNMMVNGEEFSIISPDSLKQVAIGMDTIRITPNVKCFNTTMQGLAFEEVIIPYSSASMNQELINGLGGSSELPPKISIPEGDSQLLAKTFEIQWNKDGASVIGRIYGANEKSPLGSLFHISGYSKENLPDAVKLTINNSQVSLIVIPKSGFLPRKEEILYNGGEDGYIFDKEDVVLSYEDIYNSTALNQNFQYIDPGLWKFQLEGAIPVYPTPGTFPDVVDPATGMGTSRETDTETATETETSTETETETETIVKPTKFKCGFPDFKVIDMDFQTYTRKGLEFENYKYLVDLGDHLCPDFKESQLIINLKEHAHLGRWFMNDILEDIYKNSYNGYFKAVINTEKKRKFFKNNTSALIEVTPQNLSYYGNVQDLNINISQNISCNDSDVSNCIIKSHTSAIVKLVEDSRYSSGAGRSLFEVVTISQSNTPKKWGEVLKEGDKIFIPYTVDDTIIPKSVSDGREGYYYIEFRHGKNFNNYFSYRDQLSVPALKARIENIRTFSPIYSLYTETVTATDTDSETTTETETVTATDTDSETATETETTTNTSTYSDTDTETENETSTETATVTETVTETDTDTRVEFCTFKDKELLPLAKEEGDYIVEIGENDCSFLQEDNSQRYLLRSNLEYENNFLEAALEDDISITFSLSNEMTEELDGTTVFSPAFLGFNSSKTPPLFNNQDLLPLDDCLGTTKGYSDCDVKNIHGGLFSVRNLSMVNEEIGQAMLENLLTGQFILVLYKSENIRDIFIEALDTKVLAFHYSVLSISGNVYQNSIHHLSIVEEDIVTVTATDTATATYTETETVTATETETMTETDSETDPATGTETDTETETVTATDTGTNTDSETATETETSTVTETETNTTTESETDTDTAIVTDPATGNETETETRTETVTETVTDSETATDTDTDTDSETATDTATSTETIKCKFLGIKVIEMDESISQFTFDINRNTCPSLDTDTLVLTVPNGKEFQKKMFISAYENDYSVSIGITIEKSNSNDTDKITISDRMIYANQNNSDIFYDLPLLECDNVIDGYTACSVEDIYSGVFILQQHRTLNEEQGVIYVKNIENSETYVITYDQKKFADIIQSGYGKLFGLSFSVASATSRLLMENIRMFYVIDPTTGTETETYTYTETETDTATETETYTETETDTVTATDTEVFVPTRDEFERKVFDKETFIVEASDFSILLNQDKEKAIIAIVADGICENTSVFHLTINDSVYSDGFINSLDNPEYTFLLSVNNCENREASFVGYSEDQACKNDPTYITKFASVYSGD
ncbi:MAG: hypothetical protein GY828_02900 [Candidatus Gracilibacteria bacterium]|nr:hypothetical protein [Candidatus Gracilibacteria bacterium]